jgi:hypothetical protein
MDGGRSPPPKLREENLFTDGDSRPSLKPVYKTKEEKNNWGWGNGEKEEQEETLSSLFDEVNAGTFDAEKKRKRFEPKYEWKGEVQYNSPSEAEEEEKDMDAMESSSSARPPSTREGCLMGASEALEKLTNEKDEDHDDSEWLIIKVSKKTKKESFMVDYCDGDSEDEYQWLEGPHDLQHNSVGDLLDRRRSQSRRNRRKQGHATLRSDQREIDDPNGKREADPGISHQPQEPNLVEPEKHLQGENESSNDLTIVDIHILGLFQQIERFRSGDGKVLSNTNVDALVSAMAAFSPPLIGHNSLPSNYLSVLNPVIAANWL